MNRRLKILGVLWLGLLAGCGDHYDVSVNSIVDANLTDGNTYFLVPGHPKTQPADSLLFKEFSLYAGRALELKGMSTVPTPEKASALVELYYGVSRPHRHVDT